MAILDTDIQRDTILDYITVLLFSSNEIDWVLPVLITENKKLIKNKLRPIKLSELYSRKSWLFHCIINDFLDIESLKCYQAIADKNNLTFPLPSRKERGQYLKLSRIREIQIDLDSEWDSYDDGNCLR